MTTRVWGNEYRRTVVCVDSYEKGVFKGCFFNPYQEPEIFESLTQFLIGMESLLDRMQLPQAHSSMRTFTPSFECNDDRSSLPRIQKGSVATFEIRVIFRQHASWQGVIVWLEEHREQSFRSVLELILLMDSALRNEDGSGAA